DRLEPAPEYPPMDQAPPPLRPLALLPLLKKWTQRKQPPKASAPPEFSPIPFRDLPRGTGPSTEAEPQFVRSFLASDTGRRVGVMLRLLINEEQTSAMRPGDDGRVGWSCWHHARSQRA